MATRRTSTKTYWKDIGDVRRPNANWRLDNAARYLAEQLLCLPAGTIVFLRPDGTRARGNKTLGALRKEWIRHQTGL